MTSVTDTRDDAHTLDQIVCLLLAGILTKKEARRLAMPIIKRIAGATP